MQCLKVYRSDLYISIKYTVHIGGFRKYTGRQYTGPGEAGVGGGAVRCGMGAEGAGFLITYEKLEEAPKASRRCGDYLAPQPRTFWNTDFENHDFLLKNDYLRM